MPRIPTVAPTPGAAALPALAALPVKGWPLHRYLLAMILAVLLPLLIFVSGLIWYDVTRQYDIHQRGMLDMARALSLAVDREWAILHTMLQTLAVSPLLDTEDFGAFYDLCAQATEPHSGAWIVLVAPSGEQLVNTLRPFGVALHNMFTTGKELRPEVRPGELPLTSTESVRQAFQTGEPVYSNLFIGVIPQRPVISLSMPVRRQGRIIYVLNLGLFPDIFTRLLQRYGMSADSISVIVDRRDMIIARNWTPERFVGRPTTLALHADLTVSNTSWGRGRTGEQVPVYYAWTRSSLTRWTTIISTTEASISRPIIRSLGFWGGGAICALSLAIGLALLVARKVTAPLTALTRSADLLQRGQPFAMPPVAVQEIRELSAALAMTAEAIRQQAAERERRLIAETEAAERRRLAEVLTEANTALQQAEANERTLRERWQTTLASIGDAVIVTDAAGRVGFLNAVAQTLTGWPADEALERPLAEVFRIIDEYTSQSVESPVSRVLREGVVVGSANHVILLRRDGRKVAIDDSAAPIRDAHGTLLGVVLVFRDISERQQREAAQRFLAEASTLLTAELDITTQLEQLARLLVPTLGDWCTIDLLQDDGRIHRVAVVHADPAKAALAEQLRQHYPLLTTNASHTLAQVLRTGQSWFDPEASPARLRASARDTAHWELTQALGFTAEIVVPLRARGRMLGTITCVLGEGTRRYGVGDLTLAEDLAHRAALALDNARLYREARDAQAALQQAHDVLEQRILERTAALESAHAERQRLEQEARRAEHFALLGRLAAGVSHEIRNPLGAIFLHVDLLTEELAEPSLDSEEVIAEALTEIKMNLARVEDLVQDYLSLVRVSTLQHEVEDLGAALQTWDTEFQCEAATRGMHCQLVEVAELGLVAFHANTLHRALLNLVHNACEAMAPGGTVTLAGHSTPDEIQLQVRDTGCGIAAEYLTQIFEPLYTTKPGGTGLGLYIVQEIIAAHGGRVRVESVVGKGTTFTLTLPRATPPSGHEPSQP